MRVNGSKTGVSRRETQVNSSGTQRNGRDYDASSITTILLFTLSEFYLSSSFSPLVNPDLVGVVHRFVTDPPPP